MNVASIKRLRTLDLIPNLSSIEFSKCPVCVEAKLTKKPCKTVTSSHILSVQFVLKQTQVQRVTQLLELVHTDLAVF